MGLREEVLEEFVDAGRLGDRYYGSGHGDVDRKDYEQYAMHHGSGVGWSWLPSNDAAAKFIKADENTRQKMRQEPREIPKDVEPIYDGKKRWGTITMRDAEYIRAAMGEVSGRSLAKRYGVAHITIQRIQNGKTFRPDRCRPGAAEIRLLKRREERSREAELQAAVQPEAVPGAA